MRPATAPALVLAGLTGLTACKCPSTVLGVHDGDRMATTIEAKYSGPQNADWQGAQLNRCTGLDDLVAGSTLFLRANFSVPADGCATDNLLLTLEDSGSASLAASAGLGANQFDVHLDGGCTGSDYIEFTSGGSSEPSLYDNDNSPDGGAASWYLGRAFYATPDSGCAVPSPCSDLFIANNRKL
jgi:hypothetical protein